MLIVISNPTYIPNEAAIINTLFEEGMEIFHLRKPGLDKAEVRELIKGIKPQYYSKIALHQHHELAEDFEITRIHYTEEKRKETCEEELLQLVKKGIILSTSIHKMKEYKKISTNFSYTFFGAVFNSISKQGYKSTIAEDFVFPMELNYPKVIAIGGIEAENIKTVIKMNFSGVAVLGTIWQQPEKSIQNYRDLQKVWKQTGR